MMELTRIQKSPLTKRVLRSMPRVYSAICRSRQFYSESIRGASGKRLYARNRSIFSMSEIDVNYCKQLTEQGYTVLTDLFDTTFIDGIYKKADRYFRDTQIGLNPIYPGKYLPLERLTYEQISSTHPKRFFSRVATASLFFNLVLETH